MVLDKWWTRDKVQPETPYYQRTSEEPSLRTHYVRLANNVRPTTSLSRASLLSTAVLIPIPTVRREPRILVALLGSICLAWTLLLLGLTAAPNQTINFIMRTEKFDGGSFWRLVHPSPTVLALGIAGLWGVAAGFFTLLVRIGKGKMSTAVRKNSGFGALTERLVPLKYSSGVNIEHFLPSSTLQLIEKVRSNDLIRHFGGDVVMDSVLLYQILEAGSPILLVGIFSTITVANTVASAVFLGFHSEKYSPLLETLVYIMFDFLVAIGYPMMALTYCIVTFNFNRELLDINLDIYPTGWFETLASVIADPVQTAVIHKLLKSLRIVSALDFFARVGINLFLCVRLHHVVGLLDAPTPRNNQLLKTESKYRYATGGCFMLLAVTHIVFITQSIHVSTVACEPHTEWVVHAWRWLWSSPQRDSLTECPCLTLIDVDTAPKSHTEWLQPMNITDKVAQLASTGDLQAIQIANRFLPELPIELRRCSQLMHLSLVYTHTETLPDWFKEFTNLEFLHIEGQTLSSLTSLPNDVFDDMSSLTYIHFGGHLRLRRFPSLNGLKSLKTLTLAILLSLTELPDFDHLKNLERIQLSSMTTLDHLPDLTPVSDEQKSFVVSDRGAWCCNGFLGACNLEDPLCGVHPVFETPAASCLTENIATAGIIAIVNKFSASICGDVLQAGTVQRDPTEASMLQCNGTLYRECHEPGYVEAMCYSARLMGIACHPNVYPIAMRRRQIKKASESRVIRRSRSGWDARESDGITGIDFLGL